VTKRVIVTTGLKARGYVDGRYVGEEKPDHRRGEYAGKKRRGKAVDGNRKRARKGGQKGAVQGRAAQDDLGNVLPGAKRTRRARAQGLLAGSPLGQPPLGNTTGSGARAKNARKNRARKKTPFRSPSQSNAAPLSTAGSYSPSEVAQMLRAGNEARTGQFAEALAAQANVKRERLHKVMAQSGIGSRRDMEIIISSGRVMVNGIVATTGTTIAPDDKVMIDQRPVVLKFSKELPRVLLYHKPEGEIVTTDDPGNRITVFDNLPKVENGKWINVGRLDINTSGLLIFTTSGELANRFMHPRYEVEREYAVRLLGELSEEQEAKLLAGVHLDFSRRQGADPEDRPEDLDDERQPDVDEPSRDDDGHAPDLPARLERIERREGEQGEGANQWIHVVIKEGRNREVRRLFEAVGITVSRLIRTRFGDLVLPPRLKRGMMQELTPDEVRRVLRSRGMDDLAGAPGAGEGHRRRGLRGKAASHPSPRPRAASRHAPRPGSPGDHDGAVAGIEPDGSDESGATRKRRNRRRKRGRGKPGVGDTQANVSFNPPGLDMHRADSAPDGDAARDAGGKDAARAGLPHDPSQPRKRPRRNFRKRQRRSGGGGEGGGAPPSGGVEGAGTDS
jgi:23S rRNA pseudouridine2605 synthase